MSTDRTRASVARGRQRRCVFTLLAATGLILAACGSSSSSTTSGGGANQCKTGGNGNGPWGWQGDDTQGYIAPSEPDVNCDGKVVVGLLSPGDTNDHGYYESFVDTAKQFAQANGWQLTIVDKINPADAVTQARNLCRQHVDMVAVAASELKDAVPVASEQVCKDTLWYVAGGQGVVQTKYFVQSKDVAEESAYVSGVAAGELMKAAGVTKAGFVTGPQLDFAVVFAKGYLAGIRSIVPAATLAVTYTGSFDDSGKAVEAARAQIAQGVKIIYPYLGGATDAVASLANQSSVPALTPGTNRCGGGSPSFAISVIFSPGDYFAAALGPFKDGKLRVGTARVWRIGKDPVPSVKICSPSAGQQEAVDAATKQIADGTIDPKALAAAITLT